MWYKLMSVWYNKIAQKGLKNAFLAPKRGLEKWACGTQQIPATMRLPGHLGSMVSFFFNFRKKNIYRRII